jgi:hypothetical protein
MEGKDFVFPQGTSHGLSKRELFAAFAMNGLLHHSPSWPSDVALAEAAFRIADAMLDAADLTTGTIPPNFGG